MGVLNWMSKGLWGEGPRLSKSKRSPPPTFEQLEPRILLSGEGFLSPQLATPEPANDQSVIEYPLLEDVSLFGAASVKVDQNVTVRDGSLASNGDVSIDKDSRVEDISGGVN